MNKALSFAALAITLSPFWHPQSKPTEEVEIDRQEVVNLEHETARALQFNNVTFFRRVYSDDFIGTTSYGGAVDKAKFLNAVESSPAKYESFTASDIRVRFYRDTAVVNCLWSARGTTRGHFFSSQSRVIHVYINGPRGWQAVASQETPLPGEGR